MEIDLAQPALRRSNVRVSDLALAFGDEVKINMEVNHCGRRSAHLGPVVIVP